MPIKSIGDGYKSYIAAGALALFAIYGLFSGHLSTEQAIPLLFNAFAVFGIRRAVEPK